MRYFFFIIFLFATFHSFGEGTSDTLPKAVTKALKKQFGKEELHLIEKKINDQIFHHDKFFSIQTRNDSGLKGYLHYGRVKTCRAGGCDAPTADPASFDSEYFDYFIIFDPDLSVQMIKVFNYQASYGHEISANGWLNQFRGFTGKKSLEVGKDIDAISGATVSVHAITDDVQWKTKLFQEMAR
ncbi:FMN-binding protein [Mariniphaga sediminis]|uniref:FMN-binding protein n=1 Tax=Mariniphaga sediminis TaxID=1628158 RepID=A0A399D2L1_9BACT|nr:FMN-binding protein [Mariniphaga sediminis]RIH64921.1 FMN-binding protein [Mariniphaga sediminis]